MHVHLRFLLAIIFNESEDDISLNYCLVSRRGFYYADDELDGSTSLSRRLLYKVILLLILDRDLGHRPSKAAENIRKKVNKYCRLASI